MTDMTPAPAPAAAPSDDAGGSETTVCISCKTDAQGNMTYSVGIEPEDEAPGAPEGGEGEGQEADDDSYMKPAKDVGDALRQAKALLEQPQSADGGPSPFEQGFANVRGAPDMGTTAGGLGQ